MANEVLIAVIDDEAPIRRFLRVALTAEGFAVVEAENAREGLRVVTQERPALIILDLGLPDQDGLAVIRQIREWSNVPIVILSARAEEKDKIMALDNGADDYLTKPFGVGELLARVRVSLRLSARVLGVSGKEQTEFSFGDIKVELLSRRVFKNKEEIKLTKIEFDLLKTLVKNASRVLTHQYLLNEVWGPNSIHEHHYVRIFIANLRKKLEKDPMRPQWIMTEQGVGYRLVVD
jgi:two-component system, OmpR family, KDP operon response regulator KdpE